MIEIFRLMKILFDNLISIAGKALEHIGNFIADILHIIPVTELEPPDSAGDVIMTLLFQLIAIGVGLGILLGIGMMLCAAGLTMEKKISRIVSYTQNDRSRDGKQTVSRLNAFFSNLMIVVLLMAVSAFWCEELSTREQIAGFIAMLLLAIVLFNLAYGPILTCDAYDGKMMLRCIGRQLLIGLYEVFMIVTLIGIILGTIYALLNRGSAETQEE